MTVCHELKIKVNPILCTQGPLKKENQHTHLFKVLQFVFVLI